MDRTLIIDGQIFQTPALYRGMGKYTDELIGSLLKINQENRSWKEIVVILSDSFGEEYDVENESGEWYKNVRLVRLGLQANNPGEDRIAESNRLVIDQFIETLETDRPSIDFFIPALFQSQICPVFPSSDHIKKILLMHDLIPLTFFKQYLSSEDIRVEYLTKFRECLKTDVYVTNSKTVANDLTLHLGISPKRIFAILGGPIDHSITEEFIDVPSPFILMPAGNDPRKNNRRGILAFKRFNVKHNNSYHLILTSFYLPHEIAEFSALSPKLVFTGNISGDQMSYLFKECAALFFPSEYEGLGLPILEAMRYDKPIACSDISVFREMSLKSYKMFNQEDVSEMADVLDLTLSSPVIKSEYKNVLDTFSWINTAKRFVEAISNHETQPRDVNIKIAVFAPHGIGSGAAETSALNITPSLIYRCPEVRYLLPLRNMDGISAVERVNYLPYLYPMQKKSSAIAELVNEREIPLYFIDNSADSAEVLSKSLAYSGVVILHDSDLGLAWESMRTTGLISPERHRLEEELNNRLNAKWSTSLLANSRAVFVWSQRLADELSIINETLPNDTRCHIDVLTVDYQELPYPELISKTKSTKYDSDKIVSKLLDIMESLR